MERTFTEPPADAIGIINGGYWYRCRNSGAEAIVYWFGGPKSPDRDVVLYDVQADVPGLGHGTLLVHEILAWCDEVGLTISGLVPDDRVDWLTGLGFVAIKRQYDSVVMGRSPVPVLSH